MKITSLTLIAFLIFSSTATTSAEALTFELDTSKILFDDFSSFYSDLFQQSSVSYVIKFSDSISVKSNNAESIVNEPKNISNHKTLKLAEHIFVSSGFDDVDSILFIKHSDDKKTTLERIWNNDRLKNIKIDKLKADNKQLQSDYDNSFLQLFLFF